MTSAKGGDTERGRVCVCVRTNDREKSEPAARRIYINTYFAYGNVIWFWLDFYHDGEIFARFSHRNAYDNECQPQ